jgi:ubiquitin C-terminal hydrolase
MNPQFKKEQYKNSKDFIIFILEQLHKELKKAIIIKGSHILNENQTFNPYDKNNVFNQFFNKFSQEASIISDLFFGIFESSNECQNCKNIYNSDNLNNRI